MPTFNGDTLIITLDAAVAVVDAKEDLYSEWKVWMKSASNAAYLPAFDTTGGDPTSPTASVSPFYFLRNDLGWRIRPAEENATVTINGNLYPRVSTVPMLIPTIGGYTAFVQIERDASAVVSSSSGSGVTAQDKLDIADKVLDELIGTARPAGSLGSTINRMLLAQTGDETIPILPTGTVQAGANSPVTFVTDLNGVNGRWRDAFLTFTTGVLAGQVKKITASTAAGQITVAGSYTGTPQPGDKFVAINR